MNITRLNISLEQYEIGLSGAVPNRADWSEPAMDRGILEFVSLFSSIVFKYGGRIVHGSHPAFTPVILQQARLHAGGRFRRPITLVMSELWAKNYAAADLEAMTDVAELIVTKQIGEGGPENARTRNESLTAMRKVLVDSQNVMVAVGGKMHRADGLIPGIGEEMDMAFSKGIPRFLIAGLGGFARELAKDLTPPSLANSLSAEANITLFSTTDISASVNLLFEHFAESDSLSDSAHQPIKWNPSLEAVVDHRDGSLWHESSDCILRAFAY